MAGLNDDAQNFMALSKECLEDASLLLSLGRYKASINRSYYAMFDAARASLAQKDIFVKTHSGIFQKFSEVYVKTGLFPVELSKKFKDAGDKRGQVDYDFESAEEWEAKMYVEAAVSFIDKILNIINGSNDKLF